MPSGSYSPAAPPRQGVKNTSIVPQLLPIGGVLPFARTRTQRPPRENQCRETAQTHKARVASLLCWWLVPPLLTGPAHGKRWSAQGQVTQLHGKATQSASAPVLFLEIGVALYYCMLVPMLLHGRKRE